MEEKELKKILNLIKQNKTKDITDYDTALLYNIFEPITGEPQEKYNTICDRLVKVTGRIYKQHLQQDNGNPPPDILKEIDDFLEEDVLDAVSPTISDYSQREGRIINIDCGSNREKASCTPEIFNKTIDTIREEQYLVLTNKGRKLLYRAIAHLRDDVIPWHQKRNYKLHIPSIGEIKIE